MNTFSVQYPSLLEDHRILVISDIHGNLSYFQGLLSKLCLRGTDQLILLGDLVEKGPESLATLRYILELEQEYRVYCVLGNCDFWHLWVDGEITDKAWDDHTVEHLLHQQETARSGLILEMCRELGLSVSRGGDLNSLKNALRNGFPREFDLLRRTPYALETEHYVFVHGGIPADVPLAEAGPWRCMKVDRYYDRRRRHDKWTVVGHTPVCLYGSDRVSAAPIVDENCRLISIDGGCVLKDDGQLNALIIENGLFSVDWYDPFPKAEALDTQEESKRSAYIRWGDNAVTLLGKEDGFCLLRHDRTGYALWAPEDMVYRKNGQLLVTDITDYRPAVAPGDTLSVVRETSCGAWIKKDGVSGWYSGRLKYLV